MPGNFDYPQMSYNLSGLNALGQGLSDYGAGLKKQRETDALTSVFSSAIKDGTIDYNALASGLAQIGKPDEAIKVLQYKQEQESKNRPKWEINPVTGEGYNANSADNPFPTASTPPPMQTAGGPTLSASPEMQPVASVPTPPPGLNPAQQKVWTDTYLKNAAESQAQNQAKAEDRAGLSTRLGSGVQDIYNLPDQFDEATFNFATGPYAGDTSSGSIAASQRNLAQIWGSIENASPWGGNYNTYDVRDRIDQATAGFTAAVKNLVRQKGEGTFTEADQRNVEAILGGLKKASSIPDYHDRVKAAVKQLNAYYGLDIPVPGETTQKTQDRFTNSPDTNGGVPVQSVPTYNVSPTQAGAAELPGDIPVPGAQTVTRNPNGAYTGPAPDGTIMTNGKRRIIKRGGRWWDLETRKPL